MSSFSFLSQLSPRQVITTCIIFASVVSTFYLIICLSLPSDATAKGASRFGGYLTVRLPSRSFLEVSKKWNELESLIIVPGHAIQWCTEGGHDPIDEQCWYLMDYQKGQVPIFVEHIRRAVELARKDSKSLLVFSGGQTRPGLGPRSEGQSYFAVAEKLGLLSGSLYDRSTTEEFARDSLENLIFSMCRFRQIVGRLPRKVTVVGFPFKARRFIDLHRKAAHVDAVNFEYISVDAPGQDSIIDDAYNDFYNDLYGCGTKLSGKRASRNPYHQQNGYSVSCPELRTILTKCL